MKTVFSTNDQVAHIWGQQSQESGRSPHPTGNGYGFRGGANSADSCRVSFRDNVFYSYSEPVARLERTAKGGRALLVTAGRNRYEPDSFGDTFESWSPSTNGHISSAVGASRHIHEGAVYRVPHVGGFTSGTPGDWRGVPVAIDHIGNARHLAAEYRRAVDSAERKRGALGRDYVEGIDWAATIENPESRYYSEGETLARRLRALWATANDYLDSFMAQDQNAISLLKGLPGSFADVDAVAADIMAEREARAARALARLTPAELARRAAAKELRAAQAERVRALRFADATEKLAGWRDGLRVDTWSFPRADSTGAAYIRATGVKRDKAGAITGGTLETSQGARVPLLDAVRVFRFLKCVRDSGHGWRPQGLRSLGVGSFAVSSVEPSGDFVAGCHRFTWGEVIALAERLGLEGLDCDDLGRRLLGGE